MKRKQNGNAVIMPADFVRRANQYEALRWQDGNGNDKNPENTWAGCGCCRSGNNIAIPGVWDQGAYSFLEKPYGEACSDGSVHPSLWSNGVNNHLNGIFAVKKGLIYQIRGYDIANLTLVKTANGWLIMDTLISGECTEAALALADEYFAQEGLLPVKGNIKAVIISHSHVDHFGGTTAVIEYNGGSRPLVIASRDFVKYALRENLFAGTAMSRRAGYQYGTALTPGTKGCISVGIGISQSTGTPGFEIPDYLIDEGMAEASQAESFAQAPYCIDGLRIQYQYTPGTEAPTEMNCYFPQYRALWMAENCNGTLHNLYTLRGAEVRDGNAWAGYLMEARELFAPQGIDAVFQAHNWPHWSEAGLADIGWTGSGPEDSPEEFLVNTAAVYKFIHDQTLLNINRGYKMEETARKIRIPKKLTDHAYLLPYYGTPSHDAKAVYQKYMGWFDMNPVHVNAMTEWEFGSRLAEYLTKGKDVAEGLREEYENGNYQFAAQLSSLLLMRQTDEMAHTKETDDALREICAASLSQLGYLSEAGTWRNAYLSAANELTSGVPHKSKSAASAMLLKLPADMLLDYIGMVFDCDRGVGIAYEDDFYLEIYETETAAADVHHVIVRGGAVLHAVSKASSYVRIARQELISVMCAALVPGCSSLKTRLKQAVSSVPSEDLTLRDKGVESLFRLLGNLEYLSLDRFSNFELVRARDQSVLVTKSADAFGAAVETELLNLRESVLDCVKVFEGLYGRMKNEKNGTLISDAADIQDCWCSKTENGVTTYGYYEKLVNQTAVLEDGRFFQQIPDDCNSGHNNDGIGPDGQFRKVEYIHAVYEMYRYLTEPYWLSATAPAGEGEKVFWLRRGIELLEPYIAEFRHRKGGIDCSDYLVFDEADMRKWKMLYSEPLLKALIKENIDFFQADFPSYRTDRNIMGIGCDGEFYQGELLHMAYLFYRELYRVYAPA